MHTSRSLAASLLLAASMTSAAGLLHAQVTTARPAYDLRLRDDRVSLSLGRVLPVREFLALAHVVTGARYVIGDDAAAAGPVALVGRIDCARSEFGGFVDTMLYLHGLRAVRQGTGDAACVRISRLPRSEAGDARAKPTTTGARLLGYDLTLDDNHVALSFERPIALRRFLEIARAVTGAPYVIGEEVAADLSVSLVGRIDCKRSEFGGFVQTMLYMHGLYVEQPGSGDSTLRVRPIRARARSC